jgi:hypothetical protein
VHDSLELIGARFVPLQEGVAIQTHLCEQEGVVWW